MLEVVNTDPAELVVIRTTTVGDSMTSGLLSKICDGIELDTPNPDTFVVVRLTIFGTPSVATPWICVAVDVLEPMTAEPTAFVVVNSTTAGTSAVPEP